MRFNSSLFLQQAVAKGGAQLEGDGEVTLPPVIQPIALLGTPYRTSQYDPLTLATNSFFSTLTNDIDGASGTVSVLGRPLAAGLWYIEGNICSAVFTNDATTNLSLQMQDSAGLSVLLWRRTHFSALAGVADAHMDTPFTMWLPIAEDNWRFRAVSGTTNIGETLRFSFHYHALKML